uniref:Glycerol-3-phosphate dehydrogenase [NAD(+)] n=2 Tax=Timema TaxID=61471 RepID=A0A7R9PA96_TIMCA|nr:unnamed protein product [Timema californicum]
MLVLSDPIQPRGSAIAKIVGTNAQRYEHINERVTMYVYEEIINGKKLTEIINETHENVKYLPGKILPSNVVAVPDVVEAAKDADVLIFVVPHQFIRTLCSTLLGRIKPTAVGLSLIKGFDVAEGGGIDLISHIITRHLKIPVSVLMGANLAGEVADEKFCETTIVYCDSSALDHVTGNIADCDSNLDLPIIGNPVYCDSSALDHVTGNIADCDSNLDLPIISNPVYCDSSALDHVTGNIADCDSNLNLPIISNPVYCDRCRDKRLAPLFRDIIQTDYFRVVVVDDVEAVEVCGALKNIVACGAGFVDGLGLGDNTKAAVIRLGLMEMIRFISVFYPGSKLSTFFESCGVADLVTTCYGGRNRKISEAFVRTGKSIEELEKELLNGQKLQGPITALEVNHMLKNKSMDDKFPLFTAIHRICVGELKPDQLINCIREHPEHM